MSSRYSVYYGRKDGSGSFLIVDFSSESPDFKNQALEGLSTEQGEVIYLAEQDNVGFFHYEHWQDGQLQRRLKYNSDSSWLCADGAPEEWEASILFSPEILSQTLREYDSDMHEEIEMLWQRKHIQAGDWFPVLGLIDIIGELRQYWDLSNASKSQDSAASLDSE